MAEIKTHELKLLSHYIDKKNPKYELNGALLCSEHNMLVSTNTRALCRIKLDSDIPESVIIPGDMIKNILNMNRSRQNQNTHVFTKSIDGVTAAITDTWYDKSTYIYPSLAGEYPEHNRIVPTAVKSVTHSQGFMELYAMISRTTAITNYIYIKPIMDYMKATNQPATISYNDKKLPIMIEVGPCQIIIMPIILDEA